MLEERKRIRIAAKEIRLQEQHIKATIREEAKMAQQANQQLKNNLKQSKKGKQRATTSSQLILEDVEDINMGCSSYINMAPISTRSRRIRPIKPPKH